jgi:hypothetical protein
MLSKNAKVRSNFIGISDNYSPPDIVYQDPYTFIVTPGRYFQAGYRAGRIYQYKTSSKYWDVTSNFPVSISSSYVAGVSSGILGGLRASSWYSVFMVGPNTTDIMILPYIKAWSVDYNASNSGKTTIVLAEHDATALLETGLLTLTGQWNSYQILKCTTDIFLGTPMTLSGSTSGTPYDQVTVDGNLVITNNLDAGDIFQLIPPATIPYLYLGSIRIISTSTLFKFVKSRWRYTWKSVPYITGYTSATVSGGDTYVGAGVSPLAVKAWLSTRTSDGSGINRAKYRHVLYSSDGNILVDHTFSESGTTAQDDWTRWEITTDWVFTQVQTIKNCFTGYDTASTAYVVQTEYGFRILAFEE